MGLRSPFDYIGYERSFLKTIIFLLNTFCKDCHSNDDYYNGCKDCPTGNLIYKSKNYLLEVEENHIFKQQLAIFKKIQQNIRTFKPKPFYPDENIEKLEQLYKELENAIR